MKCRILGLRTGCAVLFSALTVFCYCKAASSCAPDKKLTPSIREVRQLHVNAQIMSLSLSSTKNIAAVALSNGTVQVFALDSGRTEKEILFGVRRSDAAQEEAGSEIIRVRFSPIANILAVSYLSRIYLFECDTWKQIGALGVEGEDTPKWNSEGQPIDKSVAPTQKPERDPFHEYVRRSALGDGRLRVTDFAFSPDGSKVLAGYCRGTCNVALPYWSYVNAHAGGDDPVRLWDLQTGGLIWQRMFDADLVITRVVIEPRGQFFAASTTMVNAERYVYLHELSTGRRIWTLPPFYEGFDVPMIFTPDGAKLITILSEAAGGEKLYYQHLGIYDVTSGQKVGELRDRHGASNADLTPDGKWLAAQMWSEPGFQLWDLDRGAAVSKKRPSGFYWRRRFTDIIRFSPDGQLLVVGNSIDGRLAILEFQH